SSSFFLISSASAFEIPSFRVDGVLSTASLASLRPRLVISRTTLMTWIFLAPPVLRTTENSVFSSTAGAAAPPPAPPTGPAAMVTLNLVLKASMRSASSRTDLLPIASRISSLLSVVVGMFTISVRLRSGPALFAEGLEGADKGIQDAVQGPGDLGQQHLARRDLAEALTCAGGTVLPSTRT